MVFVVMHLLVEVFDCEVLVIILMLIVVLKDVVECVFGVFC